MHTSYIHIVQNTHIPFVRWVLHECGVAAAFQSLNITCNLLPTGYKAERPFWEQ